MLPAAPHRLNKRAVKRTANVLTSKENIEDLKETRAKKIRELNDRDERKKIASSKKQKILDEKLKKAQEKQEKRVKKAAEDNRKREISDEKARKRIEKLEKQKKTLKL